MRALFKDKYFDWDAEKNELLIKARNISFEDVQNAIENDGVLDVTPHPNQEKYSHQKILIVDIDEYTCAVPFVIDGDKIFFKTIYKSRKLNKKYDKK